jgi:hypothetical protein
VSEEYNVTDACGCFTAGRLGKEASYTRRCEKHRINPLTGLTLKEAVESGRRWRHKDWAAFWGPSIDDAGGIDFSVREALSSDFEIEPEPEKPREWTLCRANHESPWQLRDLRNSGRDEIRVHDADACDKKHSNCSHSTECLRSF